MRDKGNIERLRKLLWQLEEQKLQDKKNYYRKNKNLDSLDIYSNLNLAFYKLHAIKTSSLPRNINLPDKKEFLDGLKNRIESKALCEGANLLKRSIELATTQYTVEKIHADVGYRFITGTGYPSPVENGMLFHHVYGVPYIHGESVKGLVRFTYLLERFPQLMENPKEVKKLVDKLEEGKYTEDQSLQEEYSLIFGDRKHEGYVVFFDAYPTKLTKDNFVIDIMNPHYGEYYRTKGKEPPAEWDKPNPIFFLALENVEFCFILGFDPLRIDEDLGNKILEKALSCLKDGLEILGLGGKKRKGYGWFEID